MTESTLLKMANPKTREGREIGYLMVRLATAHADQVSDPEAHTQMLEQRLHSALIRTPRAQKSAPEQAPSTEPISLEQARARTAALLATIQ